MRLAVGEGKHTPGPDPVYYLRCIHRRLQTIQEAMPDEKGLCLGNVALADEADWLDCYIDQMERATAPMQEGEPSDLSGDQS